MSLLPVANHRPGDAVLLGPAGALGAAVFFAQARRLAQALPCAGHVINLCETRHGFMLGFAAALLRSQVSLLPPGRGRGDWEALARRYPGATLVSEKPVPGADTVALGAFLEERSAGALDIPAIDACAIAAILFTSGSTGEPAAHAKAWGPLCRGAQLLAAALGWSARPGHAVIGSVPPQHMFGLESTVMLPWQSGVAMHAHVPLLAADLECALADCGRPAWWMTTPVHLRAPLQASSAMPGLQGVVASTMSLAPALAVSAESAWGAPVIELYGSTETGALATRRTAREQSWTPLPGVVLREQGKGEAARVLATGPHIDPPALLGDRLDLGHDGRFLWLGRVGDMVKVAGKRASLAALDGALARIPGVADGAFAFAPQAGAAGEQSRPARRLAAFFVSETLDAARVLAQLRALIDPAFLPRPLHRVARLPRNANGKLTQAGLAQLFAQQRDLQAIGHDHPALPGHFPGDPMVPGVTLLARVAETLRERFPAFAAGELRHARFHRPLRPGEEFGVDSRMDKGAVRFEVRLRGSEGALVASGEWAPAGAAPHGPGA